MKYDEKLGFLYYEIFWFTKLFNMKIYLILLLLSLVFSCSKENKTNNRIKMQPTQEIMNEKQAKKFEFAYDKSKISPFSLEKTEDLSHKALDKKLSEYSVEELEKLPIDKKISYSIVVSTDISKENLENTLKYFVSEKVSVDNDIDEIIIFVFDNKNDIGKGPYNLGTLIWAPYGKFGNITSEIASSNSRENYSFEIEIKNKVGKVNKSDIPTERELAIYNMVMDPKYSSLSEDVLDIKVMQKFKIKTKKELDEIFAKVLTYKMKL